MVSKLKVAGVLHQGESEGDILIADIISRYKQQNWHIRGLITGQGKDLTGQKPMSVIDIQTGKEYIISEKLGPYSKGCQLNVEALQNTAQVLQKAIEEQPDLIFINRFGSAESKGSGLFQEFVQIVEAGIPLLTLVSKKYQADWQAFIQDYGLCLPLEETAICSWLNSLE